MSGADAAPVVTARRVVPGARAGEDFTYSVVLLGAPAKGHPPTPQKASGGQGGQGGERRGDGRTRTRLRDATLAEGRGRVLMDCRIRDRSRHGARLQLDKDRPLPKAFLLSEPATGACYRATLVWQAGRDAGVRLTIGP